MPSRELLPKCFSFLDAALHSGIFLQMVESMFGATVLRIRGRNMTLTACQEDGDTKMWESLLNEADTYCARLVSVHLSSSWFSSIIQIHWVPLWDCEVNLMVLKLKDFLLKAGRHIEHSLPMVSGSVISVNLYVLVCAGEELFIAFNHSSHSL